MNFEESYEKYLVLSESNGTTNNLSTDRSRYALKYNIAQNKVIEWLIESNSTDENRYLQSIKEVYETLNQKEVKEMYTSFELPEKYFEFIDLAIYGSSNNCKNQLFRSREVKGENVSNLLNDSFSKPSFKYRETFYTISKDLVQVYTDKFNIQNTKMSYYRYPVQIELENPENPESNFKQGNLEFDDKLVNRIIFSTVALHELSSDDPKYQAFKQETIQKF